MRNICIMMALCLSIGWASQVQAQSKKEKAKLKREQKKWKARKKKMMAKPLKFKDMNEGIEVLPDQNKDLTQKLGRLKKTLEYQNKENADLQKELDKLLNDSSAGTETEVPSEEGTDESSAESGATNEEGDYKKGRIFKVQISYTADDVDVSSGNTDMVGREMVDGKYKYTLGYFRDYWEARNFKNYLREVGLKDAWIVSYVDNVRTNITEALTPQEKERLDQETEN